MDVFLVGGAVRDRLLGRKIEDRDWLVVGATPEEMLSLGYQQVGADFPVFLDPESKEEYALARTERKSARGYHGFTPYFGEEVTLEEDLLRRDLTINAMAQTDDGEVIDPYGGQRDLEARVLRHVSPAFAEDPLRVLRVARFMARYADLGFTVADETLDMMRSLNSELGDLTPERVWKETSRALEEDTPAAYFETLRATGALAVLMPELDALWGVKQPQAHHPEIDTGVHVMMSLARASELTRRLDVRFAVLVHDLGKGITGQDEGDQHIGHEDKGVPLVEAICDRLKVPNDCRQLAVAVCKHHTKAHQALKMTAGRTLALMEALDALRKPDRFGHFLLACEADARGRLNFENRRYPQADVLLEGLRLANEVGTESLISQGFEGKELGEQLRHQRIKHIQYGLKLFRRQNQEPQPW